MKMYTLYSHRSSNILKKNKYISDIRRLNISALLLIYIINEFKSIVYSTKFNITRFEFDLVFFTG